LGKRGANVVVNYTSSRGAVAAATVSNSIETDGSKASIVQANVAHMPDLQKLVDAALAISENGKIDILVHNAATGDDCYLEDMTEKFYEDQTDANLKGCRMSHVKHLPLTPHSSNIPDPACSPPYCPRWPYRDDKFGFRSNGYAATDCVC
jgi:NAD(P)-dependent dehydrogenase (short-subunit alcohol dehydrogenase family)